MPYFTYILRCNDASYYVGHTTDLAERLFRHNDGRGPVYTATRRPVQMVYSEPLASIEAAVARERQIKHWTRAKKEALVSANTARLHALAKRRR
ncbi:MAG: GIY-YIG nuclease family protein [Acidobacteriota bacterium]